MGLVVDKRRALQAVQRGKPTVGKRRKAAVLGAVWRVPRPPPGSASGACLQRGNAGTWERPLSPCASPGRGDRGSKSPGVPWGFRPGYAPFGDTTNARKHTRYRSGERQVQPCEMGRWQSERRRVPMKVGK